MKLFVEFVFTLSFSSFTCCWAQTVGAGEGQSKALVATAQAGGSGADLSSRLQNLSIALEMPSFPSFSSDGIQTWKQVSNSDGTDKFFDLSNVLPGEIAEMSVSDFITFWGGDAYRL